MLEYPDQTSILAIHRRLRAADQQAREELTRLLMEPLVQEVSRRFRGIDEHLIRDGVIDALFDHCERPGNYEASAGGSLDRFLAATARRNVQDLLRSERRRKGREREVGRRKTEADVALDPVAANRLQEEKEQLEQEIQVVLNALSDPRDREILLLRLEGTRETEAFARLLKITHLPLKQQRKDVKRHKDRIQKLLTRKGFRSAFLS